MAVFIIEESLKVPTAPIPIDALVPWWGSVYPIKAKRPHPVLLWLYTIHTRRAGEGMIIHYNVSQSDLVREIELRVNWKIGASLELGPFKRKTILGRKWHFTKGDVLYKMDGPRPDRFIYMFQEELERRIKGMEESV